MIKLFYTDLKNWEHFNNTSTILGKPINEVEAYVILNPTTKGMNGEQLFLFRIVHHVYTSGCEQILDSAFVRFYTMPHEEHGNLKDTDLKKMVDETYSEYIRVYSKKTKGTNLESVEVANYELERLDAEIEEELRHFLSEQLPV